MKKLFAFTLAAAVAFSMAGCGRKPATDMSAIGYKVGVGSYTTTMDSYGYTGGKNGKGKVSTTFVTAVFDKEGIIKKAYIDEVETVLNFSGTGQLADFTPGEVRSKKDLGDGYGMRGASGIGKEWYEQIDALEKYLVGKDVNAIVGNIGSRMYSKAKSPSPANSGGSSMINSGSVANSGGSSMVNSGAMINSGTMISSGAMNDGGIPNVPNNGVGEGNASHTNGVSVPNVSGGTWQEDVKASVTISTTNIQMALRNAYANAK
ncbi:MAG: hypothetical protein RR253_02770 [Oscillospiraceae bacterium]